MGSDEKVASVPVLEPVKESVIETKTKSIAKPVGSVLEGSVLVGSVTETKTKPIKTKKILPVSVSSPIPKSLRVILTLYLRYAIQSTKSVESLVSVTDSSGKKGGKTRRIRTKKNSKNIK